jgi:hypothetical protein
MNKCPICGYTEHVPNKQESGIMNYYVNELNPANVIINNSSEPEFIIDSKPPVKYIRKDVWDKKQAEKKSAPVTAKPVTK